MRLDLLREIPEEASLRQEWNALALQVEQPQIFYIYEWARAAYRAYPETLQPLLFLAYDERNSLRGLAALATDATRQCASFLCATTGDYCDFLSSPQDRGPFVSAVLGTLGQLGIRRLRFTNLPADSPSILAIRHGAKENGLYFHARTAYVCAQVALNALKRRGEHNPVLPRKKMLRRFLNAMGREHPVRLDHCRSWETIDPVLPQFMRAHVARFLVTGRISNMARPERRAFLTELARLLSESGSVVLTRMMSGDRVFAWNYGFQFQGTWFWYQPTFDSDLEKYSPGFCLLAKVIEEASQNPSFQIVDLGLGAEDYKERFANRSQRTLFVSLKSSLFGHCAEMVRDQLSSTIRKSRKLETAIRSSMTVLHGWRRRLKAVGVRGAQRATRDLLRNPLKLRREISYYEWCDSPRSSEFQIHKLDLNHLADAAMEYVDDEETLDYLLRSTSRLRSGKGEGRVLIGPDGKLLHFAWLSPLNGSEAFESKVASSTCFPEGVLINDSWTPVSLRRTSYCTRALELIAAEAKQRGEHAWAESEARNESWIRTLKKAGFQKRFVMRRSWFFGAKVIAERSLIRDEMPAKEASARV